MRETCIRSLGLERPPGEGKVTHSSILAWRIPRSEEPGRLQSIGLQSQKQLKQLSRHLIKEEGNGTPTPVLLPGEPHGWRSLVGCSPCSCEESDRTEQLHFHFSLSCNGEGNGNPLQCSCLENPRDGGAWWAAVYGVAQGQT